MFHDVKRIFHVERRMFHVAKRTFRVVKRKTDQGVRTFSPGYFRLFPPISGKRELGDDIKGVGVTS